MQKSRHPNVSLNPSSFCMTNSVSLINLALEPFIVLQTFPIFKQFINLDKEKMS